MKIVIVVDVIQPDGTKETKTLDRYPTLQDYYGWIGCDMIQVVSTLDGREMVLDENAKLKRIVPETNPVACAYVGAPTTGDHRIVGTVVIQKEGTMQ